MGGELDTPNLEKNAFDGKKDRFRYGLNKIQGLKKTMEVYIINNDIIINQEKTIYIFGIFDGHSGNEISQYISENFSNELTKNNNFIIGEYKQAIIDTFINIDKNLKSEDVNNILMKYNEKNKFIIKEKLEQLSKDKNNIFNNDDIINISSFLEIINPNNLENVTISDYIGSSGLVILINDDITFIANAGNSHFIIIDKELKIDNKFLEKQKKYEEEEKNRIKIVKGIKYGKNFKKEEYIYTRGFGDFQYKIDNTNNIDTKDILSEPFLYEFNNIEIKYIIAFNNGFYENFINNNDCKNINYKDKEKIYNNISKYFIEKIYEGNKNLSEIISEYFDKNIVNKNKIISYSNDNLSCIIIEFFT